MSRRTYVTLSVIYLIVIALLIVFGGIVESYLDIFIGFVCGWTVHGLAIISRDRKRKLK